MPRAKPVHRRDNSRLPLRTPYAPPLRPYAGRSLSRSVPPSGMRPRRASQGRHDIPERRDPRWRRSAEYDHDSVGTPFADRSAETIGVANEVGGDWFGPFQSMLRVDLVDRMTGRRDSGAEHRHALALGGGEPLGRDGLSVDRRGWRVSAAGAGVMSGVGRGASAAADGAAVRRRRFITSERSRRISASGSMPSSRCSVAA